MNTASEGIPFSCSPDETIIIYKAVVDNPQGTAVTVGQMMLDVFFRFKSHSSDTPISPINLIPLAPKKPVEERGKTGKDYHYTRTPDSESGRNDTDVSIVFFPSYCSEFHIMNNKNTTEAHYPTPGNTIQTFIEDLPGEQLELQAHNPNTGEISALKDGTVKINKTAPAFTAAADGQLTLTDNFSGIWKLGGYDAAAKSYIIGQIGKYRAVDAAGNTSATQAVTVNDPLAVTPTDPTFPMPTPEQNATTTTSPTQ